MFFCVRMRRRADYSRSARRRSTRSTRGHTHFSAPASVLRSVQACNSTALYADDFTAVIRSASTHRLISGSNLVHSMPSRDRVRIGPNKPAGPAGLFGVTRPNVRNDCGVRCPIGNVDTCKWLLVTQKSVVSRRQPRSTRRDAQRCCYPAIDLCVADTTAANQSM